MLNNMIIDENCMLFIKLFWTLSGVYCKIQYNTRQNAWTMSIDKD